MSIFLEKQKRIIFRLSLKMGAKGEEKVKAFICYLIFVSRVDFLLLLTSFNLICINFSFVFGYKSL